MSKKGEDCMKNFKVGDRLVMEKRLGYFHNVGDMYIVTRDDHGIYRMESEDGTSSVKIDHETANKYFKKADVPHQSNATDKPEQPKKGAKKATGRRTRNRVTEQDVKDIISRSDIVVEKLFDNCTMVALEMPNGFVIVESSACVDPANYDEELGIDICMGRIRRKIQELEGYRLCNELYESLSGDDWIDDWDALLSQYDDYYSDGR